MALSFDTRIKFLLGNIWLSTSSKVIRGPSSLVLASKHVALFSSPPHPLLAMGTRSTRSSSKKSSSLLLPEEIDNLSALLENPDSLYNPDPQNTGAIPKKKSAKKTRSSHTDDPSASVENLIRLEVLRKENLATQLQITETQLKLAQLNANISSTASGAAAATPPSSLTKLRSAIAPNASSSPSFPSEFAEIPSLDQLRSRKKAAASLPNNFLFSPKGTAEYNKLELAEFVCGYLEFCKEQPESSKAPLLKHLHLLMERAITYSWSRVRNSHLSVNTIQFKQRVLEIPLPFIPNSILCPVRALKNHFCTVPERASSPLFIVNHGRSFKPILAAHFNRFFKSCITTVGLKPDNFSSPSFHRGGATFAFNCGAPTEFIKAHGDWHSDAYLVYLKLSTKKKLDILQAISARLSHLAI